MPAWIHNRAKHLKSKNPDMDESTAHAVATQQAYAAGKAPKKWKGVKFGTAEGRRTAHAKHTKPLKEYRKTAAAQQRSAAGKVGIGAATGGGVGYLASHFLKTPLLRLPMVIGGAALGGAAAVPKPSPTYQVHQGFQPRADMNYDNLIKAAQQELDLDAMEEDARQALSPFVVRKLNEDKGSTSVAAAFPSRGKVPILGIHVDETPDPYAVAGGGIGGAMLGGLAGRLAKSRALSRVLRTTGALGGGAGGAAMAGRFIQRDPDVNIAGGETDPMTALRHPALLGFQKGAQAAALEKLAASYLQAIKTPAVKGLKPVKTLEQKQPKQDRTPSWGGGSEKPVTNMAGEIKNIPPPPVT